MISADRTTAAKDPTDRRIHFKNATIQGVAIVRDSQRGVYVNFIKVCGSDAKGTENTFGKVCSEMEVASKKPATGKKFECSYLFK